MSVLRSKRKCATLAQQALSADVDPPRARGARWRGRNGHPPPPRVHCKTSGGEEDNGESANDRSEREGQHLKVQEDQRRRSFLQANCGRVHPPPTPLSGDPFVCLLLAAPSTPHATRSSWRVGVARGHKFVKSPLFVFPLLQLRLE